MPPTKPCEQCGTVFAKPPTCSAVDWTTRRFCSPQCKVDSQRGKPTWNTGKQLPKTAPRHPCRICGAPTQYIASNRRITGMVHCGQASCAAASLAERRQRISERAKQMYAAGERQASRIAWQAVARVSPEETMLTPWLTAAGWAAQHRVVPGVKGRNAPRLYHLDFALVSQQLYIEIDGSVHRLRRDRDARKDAILAALGWRGLRIPAHNVRDNPDAVRAAIAEWVAQHATSTP